MDNLFDKVLNMFESKMGAEMSIEMQSELQMVLDEAWTMGYDEKSGEIDE